MISIRSTKSGTDYDAKLTYALVATHDFTIPALSLKAFSPRLERLYTLQAPAIAIRVVPPPVSQLVAPVNRPESAYDIIGRIKQWGIYLLIFVCGYLSALLYRRVASTISLVAKSDIRTKSIREAGDAKTLMKRLIAEDAQRYGPWIERLERALYQGEKIDLKKIKKEVMNHAKR